ncbi:hypothetical protein IAR55_001516 [Kwoniella newhampshirensis]|uniref:Protein transport protein sec16 n=1 Tax=Kwoniella newhampshirensis TaxID=1651941 RepID=A0AAW0Z2H6_9TREE
MVDSQQSTGGSAEEAASTAAHIFGSDGHRGDDDNAADDVFAQLGASGGDESEIPREEGLHHAGDEITISPGSQSAPSSSSRPTDLFAQLSRPDEDNDPFAEIVREHNPEPSQDSPSTIDQDVRTTEQLPAEVLSLLDQAGGDDFDNLIGENSDATEQDQAAVANLSSTETEVPPSESVGFGGGATVGASLVPLEQKDFSDLLAEFEAENPTEIAAPMGALEDADGAGDSRLDHQLPEVPKGGTVNDLTGQASEAPIASGSTPRELESSHGPISASALFNDDPIDSAFDIIPHSDHDPEADLSISTSQSTSPSPVPSLSIEHSRIVSRPTGLGIDGAGDQSMQSTFPNASDWLQDTTFDDSMQMIPDEVSAQGSRNVEAGIVEDGHEPVPFEVPQGWYDDNGDWNWYTEEEKEQVRQAMIDQGGFAQPPTIQTPDIGLGQDKSPFISYSPDIQARAGLSENAARRTPQPESEPILSKPSYDPYAPPPANSTRPSSSYSSTSPAQFIGSSLRYDPYASASSSAPYTSATAFDPYAPTKPSAPSSYAPTSSANDYAPRNGVPSAMAAAPSKTEAKPQIKRVASNAYDPPFLRPQKSFIRPPSSVSAFASPASVTAPVMPLSPPQAINNPPPPPPSGPPRSTIDNSKPPSRGPAFAPPPPKGLARMPSNAVLQQMREQPYGGPPRAPSASEGRASLDNHNTYSPPPREPALATHPFRSPPSQSHHSLAPSRMTSAASFRGSSPPPQLAPPPTLAPPPNIGSPYVSPRVLSRGPPSRGNSPLYQPRPPSRPDLNERMRSASQSIGSNSIDQLLPPPIIDTPMQDPARRSSSEARESYNAYDDGTDFLQSQYSGGPPHMPHTRDIEQLSPLKEDFPSLSRRYDEDGEDGDGNYIRDRNSAADDYNHPRNRNQAGLQELPITETYRPSDLLSMSSPTINHRDLRDSFDSSSLGLMTDDPGRQQQQSSLSPYTPYDPVAIGRDDITNDPYAPQSTGRIANRSDDIYAPTTTNVSPTKQGFMPPSANQSRASTAAHGPSPYSPAGAKPIIIMAQQTDPYARTASPAYSSSYGLSPPTNNYFQSMPTARDPSEDTYVPQQVLEQRPVGEDPLGRTTLAARNAPIAVFGFGGSLVTAFPGAAELEGVAKGHSRGPSYGYASGRGQLWIRNVADLAAPTALKSEVATFPGPLLYDSSTSKGVAGEKKKKEALLAYLDARSEEIEKGLPYMKSSANRARREEEGKLVLVRLLKALIVGEGKLAGSPEVEDAIRTALANPASPTVSTAPIATVVSASATFSSSLYPPAPSSNATPVSANSSQLSHLSTLLAHGRKRDAALYAAEQGLWSHALIVSSSVDAELWKEIVGRFTVAELAGKAEGTAGIKAAYTLFGGMDSSSVDELVSAASITDDPSTDQWREVISSVFFHGKPTDLACLDDLGLRLLGMGLINAAHTCFILSPLSPFFDLSPASFDRGIMITHNPRDEESIIFAEVAEYARSLVPVPKGQELASVGLPQLLPFKLARAWKLAELGEVELAQKYCAAIEAGSKTGKGAQIRSLLSRPLLSSLEDLLERLTGTPSINPANALGRKVAKPGFDKLGSWIEGRLTKFIAGEEGEGPAPKPTAASGKPAGPFAQFSTISPNASGSVTRTPSMADFHGGAMTSNAFLGVQSVSRTTSPAVGFTSQFTESSSGQAQPPSHASSMSSSSYGDQYGQYQGGGSYPAWGEEAKHDDGEETPHIPIGLGDEGDFINPMSQLSLEPNGPTSSGNSAYEPPAARVQSNNNAYAAEDDDEDDLGFGNKALSRDRTPKPPAGAAGADDKASNKDETKEAAKSAAAEPSKPAEHKASWLGRLWGKKEGEASGPIKAKLGEESSMMFDPDLKRWVVKGAKGEKTVPNATPPPPRAQTASPSRASRPEPTLNSRAMSATPPPSQMSRPPPGPSSSFARSTTAPLTSSGPPPPPPSGAGFAEGPDGGIRRMKSSLAESVTASDITPPTSGSGVARPPPPSRPPTAAGASIDDLLSRPPSKRPASAMKKGARNRYVDVFQTGGEGS